MFLSPQFGSCLLHSLTWHTWAIWAKTSGTTWRRWAPALLWFFIQTLFIYTWRSKHAIIEKLFSCICTKKEPRMILPVTVRVEQHVDPLSTCFISCCFGPYLSVITVFTLHKPHQGGKQIRVQFKPTKHCRCENTLNPLLHELWQPQAGMLSIFIHL